jgi:hypothetical protein
MRSDHSRHANRTYAITSPEIGIQRLDMCAKTSMPTSKRMLANSQNMR